jgi:putative hemolysin
MSITTSKVILPGLLAALCFFSGTSLATEYIYRDLMANTLPSQKCAAKPEAAANASDAYNLTKSAKTFCETQGYGWHISEQKSSGKLVCEDCRDENNAGKQQCHLEDVVVTCKRIKPGSVGLIPGQG